MGFLAGSQESAECERAPRGILHQPGEVRSSPGSAGPGEGRGARPPSALPHSGESLWVPLGRVGVCDPPGLALWGDRAQACSAASPGTGAGMYLCPERVWGSSRALSSLGRGVTAGPFLPADPTVPAVPPVPRARPAFPGVPPQLPPVCLLAELAAVLVSQGGPAVPRVP